MYVGLRPLRRPFFRYLSSSSFSDSSKDAGDASTAKKGDDAKKGGGGSILSAKEWKRARKHLLWVVPLVSYSVMTTLVQNNKRAKDYMEKLFPWYIDHVRIQFGFPFENLDGTYEKECIDKTTDKLPIVVTCMCSFDKNKSSRSNYSTSLSMKGDTLYESMIVQLDEQLKADIGPENLDTINKIDVSFEYDWSKIDVDEIPGCDSYNNKLQSDPYSKPALISRARQEMMDSISTEEKQNTCAPVLYRSSWDTTLPSHNQLKLRKQDLLLSTSTNSDTNIQTGYMSRHNPLYLHLFDMVGSIYGSLEQYRQWCGVNTKYQGNNHVFDLLYRHKTAREKYMSNIAKIYHQQQLSNKSSNNGSSKSASNSNGGGMTRGMAEMKIKDLQGEVQALTADMATGRRDYDELAAEISKKEQEIASLRRRYINWFYFF
jgi:hypothetical protein